MLGAGGWEGGKWIGIGGGWEGGKLEGSGASLGVTGGYVGGVGAGVGGGIGAGGKLISISGVGYESRGTGRGWGGGEKFVDFYARPKYEFNYGVIDKHTGDNKRQTEVRHDDVVKGEYSLKEPDGTIRTVLYEADDKNGFNAKVIRQGPALHPEVVGGYGGQGGEGKGWRKW